MWGSQICAGVVHVGFLCGCFECASDKVRASMSILGDGSRLGSYSDRRIDLMGVSFVQFMDVH